MSYKIKKEYLHVRDDNGNWITVDALADSPASARLAEQLSLALDAIANAGYVSSNADNTLTGKLTLNSKDLEIKQGNLLFSNASSNSSQNGIRWLVSNTKTDDVTNYHKIYHELDTDSNQVLKLKYHTYNFDGNNELLAAESGDEKVLLSTNGNEINLCETVNVDYTSKNVTLTEGNLTISTGKLILSTNNIELHNGGNLFFTDASASSSQNGIRWLVSSVENSHRIYWEMDTTSNHLLQIRYQRYNLDANNSVISSEIPTPITLISMSPDYLTLNKAIIVSPTINNGTINNATIDSPIISNPALTDAVINGLTIGNNWEFKQIALKAGGANGVVPSKITGTLVYQLNLTPDQIYILSMWTPGYIPEFFVSGAETTGGNIPCGIALRGLDGEYKDVITSSTEKTIYITYLQQNGSASLAWA